MGGWGGGGENGQNQALKSSCVEVKFLTLALRFSLLFLFDLVFIYVFCLL